MQVSILDHVFGGADFVSLAVRAAAGAWLRVYASGMCVERLRRGEKSRGSLLLSSLVFYRRLSVVFISFGASASAVRQFLLQNKSLLTPFAGVIIVLFGLHLIGALRRVPSCAPA